MSSLGDEFAIEQARCRQLLGAYKWLSGMPQVNTKFAEAMIEDVLQRADRAVMSGDVIEMIRVYEEMRGCE